MAKKTTKVGSFNLKNPYFTLSAQESSPGLVRQSEESVATTEEVSSSSYDLKNLHIPSSSSSSMIRNDEMCSDPNEDMMSETSPSGDQEQQDSNSNNNGVPMKKTLFYSCDKCKKQYAHLKSYQNHVCKTFLTKIPCLICSKLICKTNISHHMKIHKQAKFCCNKCKRYFKSQALLEKHGLEHASKRYSTCGVCGKMCARPGQLIEHLKTHNNTEDRIKCFDCKFCSLDCKTLPKLKVHLENSHVDKAFKCDKCPKMYFSTKGYNTHKKTHGNS